MKMADKVDSDSFLQIDVKERSPLKKVLASSDLKFEKGKAFYEMTKSEIIQDYKCLVVMRKSDEAMVTGEKVRGVLNIPKTTTVGKFKLELSEITDFRVFVQSTSHNRVLLPDTTMLYLKGDKMEIEETPDADAPAAETATGTPASTASRASRRVRAPAVKKDEVAAAKRLARVAKEKIEEKEAGKRKIEKEGMKRTGKKIKTDEDETDGDGGDAVEAAEPPAPLTAGPPAATATASTATTSVAAAPGPGGKVEIVFSFDTTGSMYPCLGEVRRKLTEVIARLKRDVPGIRIAIIAHGDYCDTDTYVTKILDFTDDQTRLCNFVRDVGPTGGGDMPECYELVLREAQTRLSWSSSDSQKSLVMIGDATPHESNYPLNSLKIDWRKECLELKNKNIRIYSVQALNNSSSTSFYRKIAELTGGYHLHLDQFSSIANFLLAICYRECGEEPLRQFEEEIVARGMNRELHRLFDNLAGRSSTYVRRPGASTDVSGLTPINPSRFQVLKVDTKMSIKEFVQMNSLVFKTGRGFYEFTKPETISHKKEVVLIEISTGDMFTGPEACRLIGSGDPKKKIKPTILEEFRVFVQSTSYNRVLFEDTGFLYEVDPSC